MSVLVGYPGLSTLTNHRPFLLPKNFHPPLLLAALCPRADPLLYRISPEYARTYPHKHLISTRHRRINVSDRDRVFAENLEFSSNAAAEMLHSPSAIAKIWTSQYKLQDLLRIGNCIILWEFGYFSLVEIRVRTHKKELSIHSWGKRRRVSWEQLKSMSCQI
jgi:hypothetical protein